MSAIRYIQILALTLISSLAVANEVFPPLKLGVPGKQKGEIIAPVIDEQIAAWCDFSKQIVITKKNVLCAYVGGNSTSPPKVVSFRSAPVPVMTSKKKGPAVPKDLNPTLYEMNEYGDEA